MTAATLSADSQAIALLCSSLALPRGGNLKPLTPTEWNALAVRIRGSSLGRPEALFRHEADELVEELEVTRELGRRVEALLQRGGQLAIELERLANRGIWLLTRADADYPGQLKKRLGTHAPPLFFGAGPVGLLAQQGLAVVGARDVDAEGLAFADGLGRRCAAEGLAVVSGAARGVDLASMMGSLSAGGVAVGVLAESLERYAQRRDLRERIVEGALVLATTIHPRAGFHAGNAMRRNRLIYCLAQAAIVVASSAERGGTRSGALENLKAKWVPLYVRDDKSAGNRALISGGGIPFPPGQLENQSLAELSVGGRLETLFDVAARQAADTSAQTSVLDASALDVQPPNGHKPLVAGPSRQTDVFADIESDAFRLVWPSIARFLAEPRGEKEVATHLGLERSQARAWLRRAVAEGVATRLEPKGRYVVSDEQRPTR